MLGLGLVLIVSFLGATWAEEEAAAAGNPTVVMQTSQGTIEIELWPDKAPISVKNFLSYADQGFYDGTIFHRVIKGFMIQGGGLDKEMKKKTTAGPIKNEADNGLKNTTGTIAMARTPPVDSATSQFFINTVDNQALDHAGPGSRFGYAVFGKVVSGSDVVQAIESTQTTVRAGMKDVPSEPIVIESVKRKQ
jgi:cyclophilin family peptidyl-prolyl cis-trans isomerase